MKKGRIIIEREYKIIGFVHGTNFEEKFTLEDLLSNSGKMADTEVFYALQETEVERLLNMPVNTTNFVNINRDSTECKGIILRIK